MNWKFIADTNPTQYIVPSANVKVFPSTYRGFSGANGKPVDPESKLNTEFNYTHLLGNSAQDAYIVEWTKTNNTRWDGSAATWILKVVIKGYYFEIYDLGPSDLAIDENINVLYANIKLYKNQLTTDTTTHTYTLDTFLSSSSHTTLDNPINGVSYFYGLVFSTAPLEGCYQLQLLNADGTIYKGNRLPIIEANAVQSTDATTVYEGSFNTQLKDGAGATANYAVTLGGNAEASGIRSVAMGDHTVAKNENQVVIGKYNKDAADSLFVIGNGTSSTRANLVEVTPSATTVENDLVVNGDDVTVTGDVTIEGDTAFNGKITGNAGLEITAQDTVVKNTTINGTLGVSGATTLGSTLNVTGNTTLSGKLSVQQSTHLSDAVEVWGITDLDNDLFVEGKTVLENTTDISNPGGVWTAALKVAGGVVIGKKLKIADSSYPHSSGFGALEVEGGARIKGNLELGPKRDDGTYLVVNSTTDATSSVKGAARIKGGATVDKSLYVKDLYVNNTLNVTGTSTFTNKITGNNGLEVASGNLTVAGTTTSSGKITGSNGLEVIAGTTTLGGVLTANGAVTVNNDFTASGIIKLTNTSQANSSGTTTAAVRTSGGVDIAKNLVVHGSTYLKNPLEVNGTITATSLNVTSAGIDIGGGTISLSGDQGLVINTDVCIASGATGNAWDLYVSGAVDAQSFNARSDRRLKENIQSYVSNKSILDLPVYRYDFIYGEKNKIGCVAQELQEICPEIVHENKYGYLTIEENKIVYLLLEEVKKLKKELDEIKNK